MYKQMYRPITAKNSLGKPYTVSHNENKVSIQIQN